MARNRKRAKERRRQSISAPASRPAGAELAAGRGVVTARPDHDPEALELDGLDGRELEVRRLEDGNAADELEAESAPGSELGGGAVPGPLMHAAPDVELAGAQLAVGRPEPIGDEELTDAADEAEGVDAYQDEEEQANGRAEAVDRRGARTAAAGGAVAEGRQDALPEVRQPAGGRVVHFLQGSWRELQRVQWPNRQQVMQATGVVIGFVIVAGLFLGLADLVATKLVNLILQ